MESYIGKVDKGASQTIKHEKSKTSNEDLSYLIGFFKGDGYFTYGRIGVDTISPDIANRLVEILSELSEKKIKIEVYGNPEKFLKILQKDSLFYPKRNDKHSDYVKIRIDSVEFSNKFKNILNEFENNTNQADPCIICNYLQGFFDAEAYVSPQGTVEIDLCKESISLLTHISKLLEIVGIKNSIKIQKSKIRLVILGGTKNISNIVEFRNKVGFYMATKSEGLENIISIYSKSRDMRTYSEIRKLILDFIEYGKLIELKDIMKIVDIKYEKLLRSLNKLIRERKLQKTRSGKRVFIQFVS